MHNDAAVSGAVSGASAAYGAEQMPELGCIQVPQHLYGHLLPLEGLLLLDILDVEGRQGACYNGTHQKADEEVVEMHSSSLTIRLYAVHQTT